MSDGDEKKHAGAGDFDASHHHHHHHQHSGDSDAGHHHHQQPPQPYYGTFPGVPAYGGPQEPAIGFPQPAPPPGAYASAPPYHHAGYQAVPVAEGRPLVAVREHRLPCCGLGLGWFLFIIGFFLAAVPWYLGAIIVLCSRSIDHREKPGYVACTIAAVLAIIAVTLGVTKGTHAW